METPLQSPSTLNEKPSIWGMITDPQKQFERMKVSPTVGIPLLIMTVIVVVLTGIQLTLLVNNPEAFTKMMTASGGQLPPGIDIESMKGFFIGTGLFSALFTVVITAVISAFFTWLVVMLFQGDLNFNQAFSMSLHLWIINALSMVVGIITLGLFGLSPVVPVTSIASIVEVKGFLKGFLKSLDVFVIWSTVLYAMGLRIVANLQSGKAWTIAILFWLLGALLYGAIDMFSGMFSGGSMGV